MITMLILASIYLLVHSMYSDSQGFRSFIYNRLMPFVFGNALGYHVLLHLGYVPEVINITNYIS